MNNSLTIRFANENDVSLILDFIKDLARYEKLIDEVSASEEILYENLFKKRYAEVLIVELNKDPIGFALFFHILYLEIFPLYIDPQCKFQVYLKMLKNYGKICVYYITK